MIVEERPEDGVGEAIVMAIGDVVIEVHSLAGVFFKKTFVDKRTVFWWNEETWPANPGKGHALFATGKSGDETTGRHLEMIFSLRISRDSDGKTVRDDDEVPLLTVEVETEGVRARDGGAWGHGEKRGGWVRAY